MQGQKEPGGTVGGKTVGFVDSVSQKLREAVMWWVAVIVEGVPGGSRDDLSRASPVLGSSASSGEKAVSCWAPCRMPCELGNLAIALVTMLNSSTGHSWLHLLCCHR